MSDAGSTLSPVFESHLFESFYGDHETCKRQLAPVAFFSKHQRSSTRSIQPAILSQVRLDLSDNIDLKLQSFNILI